MSDLSFGVYMQLRDGDESCWFAGCIDKCCQIIGRYFEPGGPVNLPWDSEHECWGRIFAPQSIPKAAGLQSFWRVLLKQRSGLLPKRVGHDQFGWYTHVCLP